MYDLLHYVSRVATISGMKLSREGAISNLKLFFGDAEADYISVDDIFTNAARSAYSLESNRKWLYNRLTLIRPYGLFEKVNGIQNGVRVTQGLALTPEGRRAVYGGESVGQGSGVRRHGSALRSVTIQSVRDDVRVLRKMYPEFDVVFDLKLKREDDNSTTDRC